MRRNGNKYERVPLQPVRKVGDPAFISDEQVVLKLKQSFGVSGADYEISIDGKPVLRSSGRAFTLYDKKIVCTPSGELFRIKTTSIVPKAFSCYDAKGERFSVKSKLLSFRTQFTIFVAPVSGSEDAGAELYLRGTAVSSAAMVTRRIRGECETLAEIKRDILSPTDLVLNGHDYTVTVAPGADWALMAAVALCFNDCLNEPRPTGGGRWRGKSREADEWVKGTPEPEDETQRVSGQQRTSKLQLTSEPPSAPVQPQVPIITVTVESPPITRLPSEAQVLASNVPSEAPGLKDNMPADTQVPVQA